jgi:PAS domain S-box-containing protein
MTAFSKPVPSQPTRPGLWPALPILSIAGAAASIVAGVITILGWVYDVRRLTDWNNDGVSMFVNTAVCAILCGAALLLIHCKSRWLMMTGRLAAAAVTVIAGLTLVEHLTGLNLGIDTFLLDRPWGQRAAIAPMRMGPPAATSFVILGIALLGASLGGPARRVASYLALGAVFIAWLSLTGYWFGADQLYLIAQVTGIAYQTSLLLAVLGVSLIAAIHEFGPAELFLRRDGGGHAFRQLLIPVIALPVILGWLLVRGEREHWFDPAFGTALLSLIEVGLFVALLWWTASGISRSDAAARIAESRLGAIIESSGDAIVSKTLAGTILTWNDAAERMFGYSSAEAVGQHITLIIPTERLAEEDDIIARLKRGERIEHFETVRRRKDGEFIHVSLSVSPVRGAGGAVIGAAKIARDITERIRAQEAIQRNQEELKLLVDERSRLLDAERAARAEAERAGIMKDEFLSTLSHELRTPLSAIFGWSQLLETGRLGPEETQEAVEAIGRNARMQTQLIDDLLDMSRIVSGKIRLDIQPLDLAEVVQRAVESVRPSADARQIQLRKIIDPHAGPIKGDPTRLQQVIWNLLTNAIKFTPKGGKVDVVLERVNSHVEITVHDSGVGIKPEFLPHVFERFRQADSSTTRVYGGLGIGLSIVKSLVELHGGTVAVKSAGENQGTTFFITLPLVPVKEGEDREHPKSYQPPTIDCEELNLGGIKILVVDDDADARALISRVLRQCEAEVATAANAHDALQILSHSRPDVVVSDIGMPDKDGYQFIRELRQLPADQGGKTPAVALTAFARSEDRTRALLAGYQVHLSKPIEPQELLAAVGSVVGRTAAG